MSFEHTDTIIALATAQGVGAISVIRLSGVNCIEICDKAFKGADLTAQKSHTIHYGHIVDGYTIVDEVMVSLFHSPRSFTTENSVEISCHGSSYITQQVIELLVKHGARLAKPGEFTMRAFLNGRIDLSQAEAVADLIAADTSKTHSIALNQMRGGFSNKISALRQELIHFASMIELELDFGEEDVEFADRKDLIDLIESLQNEIQPLIKSFKLGNVIKNGVMTVIVGRPNAGKSTLLNALLEDERAIVSDIAGTTRDTIEELINIDGIHFRLIDTAGLRDATDKIEAIGVEKALKTAAQSAILIYVFDACELKADDVQNDLRKLYKEGMRIIICGNKMDLLNPQEKENWIDNLAAVREQFDYATFIGISAKEGNNVALLKSELVEYYLNDTNLSDDTIVTNVRHHQALQGASSTLMDVTNSINTGVSGDLIALDIKHALQYLGEITGEITNEDLLDNIFSKFCIGK